MPQSKTKKTESWEICIANAIVEADIVDLENDGCGYPTVYQLIKNYLQEQINHGTE